MSFKGRESTGSIRCRLRPRAQATDWSALSSALLTIGLVPRPREGTLHGVVTPQR
jgi:hypothetical protein